ncbi:hypothetical protein BDAP_000533 [Binucleata daphniae]
MKKRRIYKAKVMFQDDKIDITHINDRLYVVGQCWKNRSEKMSERNNTQELKDYLDAKFTNKYLLWRFDQFYNDKIFEQAVLYGKPEFSLVMAVSLGKSIRGWYHLNAKNVCIIEMKGNVTKILFLISCALRFSNLFTNTYDAYKHIVNKRYKSDKYETKTLNKFLKYFDRMLAKDYKSNCVLRLKQAIITKIPKMSKDGCKPLFKVVKDDVEKEIDSSKLMIDDNYIVSEFYDVSLVGDTKLQLYHKEEKTKHLVFEISINTSFMSEGLYRFTISDISFPFSNAIVNKRIGTDFLVDIVLMDTNSTEKHTYNVDSSNIDNLRALSQHHNVIADQPDLKSLVKSGYNRVYARILLQLGNSKQEVVDKIKNLSLKEQGLVKKVNTMLQKNIDKQILFENTKQKEDTRSVCEQAYFKKPFNPIDYSSTSTTLGELDLIPDKYVFQAEDSKKNQLKGKFLFKNLAKKMQTVDQHENEPSLVVKNPLHWQTLVAVNNTFFQDIEKIKFVYDQTKFEEWFCEPISSIAIKQDYLPTKSVINDEKRVFLMSIAFKTLEKRKIDFKNLRNIMYNESFTLDLEDLQNIQRVIPTKSELDRLDAYLKDKNNSIAELNQVEKLFFADKNNAELNDLITLLIFERRFADDVELLEKDLRHTKHLFDSISQSNNIRIILKAALDIGNLFNYNYSKSKFKKRAVGFKLSSLKSFLQHKSSKNDKNLLSYIYLTLMKNHPNVFACFDEFKLLSSVKNDDLTGYKDKINKFILNYQDAKHRLARLDEEDKIVIHLKKFMTFVYDKLKFFSSTYREIIFLSGVLKRKFGESDSENINDLLTILHSFIERLQEEHNLQIM